MSYLQFNDNDAMQIRLNLGESITEENLSGFDIASSTINGEAHDYVFNQSFLNVDISTFPMSQPIALGTATSEQIESFLSSALNAKQLDLFKRAMIFRAAGLCAYIIDRIAAENVLVVRTTIQTRANQEVQKELFDRCDSAIVRLRDLFPETVSQQQGYVLFDIA